MSPLFDENKEFLRRGFSEYIDDVQNNVAKMMEMYKQNPTFPNDFYNLFLREADTKVQAVKELYRRLTDEDF